MFYMNFQFNFLFFLFYFFFKFFFIFYFFIRNFVPNDFFFFLKFFFTLHGAAFFLPHGTRIFQNLLLFLRSEYAIRGYNEVMTPLMFNPSLWNTSGHLTHYQENIMNLKPMNCPAHCVIYGMEGSRSYRQLPLRIADSLGGLTRLRHFHQDDAHIFCTHDQISSEISDCLDFVEKVYSLLGFTINLKLSTRPEKSLIGSDIDWMNAENSLSEALTKKYGKNGWSVDPGEGAFYGPKIDVIVTDALNRKHVRFFHYEFHIFFFFFFFFQKFISKFPVWLSPRHCSIIPISNETHGEFAKAICNKMVRNHIYADIDDSANTLNKRVRDAQISQYVRDEEIGDWSVGNDVENVFVNIRKRDGDVIGKKKLSEFMNHIQNEISCPEPFVVS
eukprot:GSMAST32.ASY1.ANO1.1425.1 assembled CDS